MPVDICTKTLVRPYVWGLCLLAILFAFRVMAQLLQAWFPVSYLPAFDSWHSDTVPYGWLLGTQVLILVWCLRIVWNMFEHRVILSRKKGSLLLIVGLLYFGVMSIRFVLGLTVASDHEWFGATLPTMFHLVLASFVILYGRVHHLASRSECVIPQGQTS